MLLWLPASYAQEPATLFQQGVERYRQEDWEGAAKTWESVVSRGEASGELFYNLGNAYHRMGQIGRSILFYERARRLLPRDQDVQSNLGLARMGTVDRIEPPVRLIVWDWVDQVRDYFSLRELSRLVFGIGGLLAFAVVLWRFGPVRFRRQARSLAVGVLVMYFVTTAWYVWRSQLDARAFAIVIATKVDVYSAPDSAATQVFTLHEGIKVQWLDNLTGWTRIRLPDGRQGWMPTETMERI